MKKILSFIFLLAILASCSTISYSPKITLDVSPKTIEKKVQIDRFEDLTDYKSRKNPLMGVNLINSKSLVGELDLEITNLLISDFQVNQVFKEANRKIDSPDYILRGKILKYSSVAKPNAFSYFASTGGLVLYFFGFGAFEATGNTAYLAFSIPFVLPFFGVPVNVNEVEIELEIDVYDSKDILIKKYKVGKGYRESYTIYNNNILALQSQTNKTLSAVIQELRNKILADF